MHRQRSSAVISPSRSRCDLSPQMVFELFEFVGVLRVRPKISSQQLRGDIKRFPSIQQAVWHESEDDNLLALLCSNGSLLLRAEDRGRPAVVKQVSWFQNPSKAIRTIALDPSGSWLLCGCLDSSLYLVPVSGLVRDCQECSSCHWSTEDITLIQKNDRRGLLSSIVWWHTVDGLHICIVGSELGEISFVDLKLKRVVAAVDVKESITSLELVQDKLHETTALLINTISSDTLQMQLEYKSILKASYEQMTVSSSVASAMGYEMVGKVAIPMESVFLGIGNLQDKIKPMPVMSATGVIQFSVQYARNQVFIGAHNRKSDILEVYDIDVENLPMFVYQLPPGTSTVLLTNRVIFTVVQQEHENETLLCVQCSQLAETSLSVPKAHQKTDSSIIQTFALHPEEKVVAIFRHSETVDEILLEDDNINDEVRCSTQRVDGVIVVTTSAVYQCRPRISPDKLFLELAVNTTDTSAADVLAITSGLDVNKLYEMAGDEALTQGKYDHALKLYHLSKCSFDRRVAQFAKHGRVADILTHLRQALSKHSDVHTAERKQLSNLTLFCFIQQILESSGDIAQNRSLCEAFSQFINDNFDYDEYTALEELSAHGLKDLMFDVAKARGLMTEALEMLAQKGQFHLSTELQAKLASRGFTDIIGKAANGAFIQCMNPDNAVIFLLAQPKTILSHVKFLLSNLMSLNEESLIHIARVLDPSRPSFRSLAAKIRPPRQRTASGSSISSLVSLESTVSLCKEESKQPNLEDLIELFLCSLLVLNHIRDNKMDAMSRLPAVNYLCGRDAMTANGYGRKREGTIDLLYRPVRLACGQQHTAVVSSSGDVYTWGRSQKGRLGHGDLIEEEGRSVPFRVEILHMHRIKVLSVACGIEHTLALCNVGVYSWGSSEYGQLGLGDTQQQTRPVYITELSDKRCIAVTCGHYHSMALSADHRVWAWGWGVHGQLGLGCIEDVLLPTHVTSLDEHDVTMLAAGYSHSAALNSQGQVFTFGGGLYGQLGLGTNTKHTLPQLVEALKYEKVYLICCGSFETLAVTEDQKIYNWGRSPHIFRFCMRQEFRAKRPQQAALPSSSVSHRLSPVQMDCSFSSQLKEVCCGNWHYLALTDSGQVYSWGLNDHGQLGLGNKMDSQVTPRLVHKLSNKSVTSISVGAEFSVAMDATGWVWVWGRADSGQLGLDLGSTGIGKKEVPLPCHLTSLPQLNQNVSIANELPIRPDLSLDEDVDWDLPDLSSFGSKSVPYGREALTVALHHLSDQYPAQKMIRHCIDIKDFLAAAVIYECLSDWPQVLGCGLRFLSTCTSTEICEEEKNKVLIYALDLMHHVTGKYLEAEADEAQYSQHSVWLLEEILQFWFAKSLPTSNLEIFLTYHLDELCYPLSLILIRDPVISAVKQQNQQSHQESKADDSSSCMPQFSTEFLNKVVTHVMDKIHESEIEDQYHFDLLECLEKFVSMENTDSDSASASKIENLQLGAGIPQSEFTVASKHLWQEILENIKKDFQRHPHITLSVHTAATIAAAAVSQQRDWGPEREIVSELQADVVLFSCNHHFPRVYFVEFVLPEFQQRMWELVFPLKHTIKLLLRYYGKLEGCMPTACPVCVYNSVRTEQLEIVSQAGSMKNESFMAKPWEI